MFNTTTGDGPKLARMKYQVTSVLSSVAHGTVVRVLDRAPGGREYALRVLKREEAADDVAIERARAEAEASHKLNHPAILRVHDFRTRKSWFRVARAEQLMEYVPDAKPLDPAARLDVGPLALIFQQAAAALAHMHRRGVIHGDFQPSGVLLGRGGKVRVRGYGINLVAEAVRAGIKPHGNYAAPELARTKTHDALTDVYSWAAAFYHAATGRPATSGLMGRREEGEKIPKPSAINPAIPSKLNDLLMSSLQTSPARRPASAYAVVKEMEGIGQSLGLRPEELGVLTTAEE